ncbi:MAG: lipid asymmetry maintenance protein MlaB [Burkholderiaceae bacterium]
MLALPERLTHAESAACVQALVAQVDQAARGVSAGAAAGGGVSGGAGSEGAAVVEADASALKQFDSSALAVLLECRRAAQRAGAGFAVRGLPERLRTLAGLYGVADLLPAA